MVTFSNGQYDMDEETYVFDPSKGKNGRFVPTFDFNTIVWMDIHAMKIEEVSKKHPNLVILNYKSKIVPHLTNKKKREYAMHLWNKGKIVRSVENRGLYKSSYYEPEGRLESDNKIYEEEVKEMLRKAREISQKRD